MEGVATQRTLGQVCLLPAECGEAFLHGDATGKQLCHGVRIPFFVSDGIEEHHHTAAFGEQGFVGIDMIMELGK